MICPRCNKQLRVPMYAEHNAHTYGRSCNVVTVCCDQMVTLTPVTTLRVSCSEHLDTLEEDDWGRSPRRKTSI